MHVVKFLMLRYALKTGIPVEEGDSILKLLQRVSHPEIQLGVGFHSEFSSQEQIAYFLTQEGISSFISNFSE